MSLYPSYILVSSKRYRPEQAQPVRTLFRVPHDLERINFDAGDLRFGGPGYRSGVVRGAVTSTGNPMPEVYRLQPSQTTPIGEAHQWQWRNINPNLSNDKFCRLLGNAYAWTNRTGWPGRRNYILQQDMTADLPRFHAALINGGAVVEGEERDGRVYIRSMLTSDRVLAEQVVIREGLWFHGTSVNIRGEINFMMKLGIDGQYHKVRAPLLHKVPVWLPANELHKLPAGFLPPDERWMA